MCGRFALDTSIKMLKQQFSGVSLPNTLAPEVQMAPTMPILCLLESPDRMRHILSLRWGLIPFWAKDTKIGNSMINARIDSLNEKAAFKNSFRTKRCAIIMNGFFEWRMNDGVKQPYYFRYENPHHLMTVAGIWESWQSPSNDTTIQSCSIITTDADDLVAPYHHRMPLILDKERLSIWINNAKFDAAQLLNPFATYDEPLTIYPVTTRVNSARYQNYDATKPITE